MHGINKTNIKMVDLKLNQSLTTLNLITSNLTNQTDHVDHSLALLKERVQFILVQSLSCVQIFANP